MRVIQGDANKDFKLRNLTESSAAPAITTERTSRERLHGVQLARQVQANLSLLEDSHQRMQFMLREVSGLVSQR